MQSLPSQQGSGEGVVWVPCPSVSMASCSITEPSQQEGTAGTGLCMSQSGGQNVCAIAAGPIKPTAATRRGTTRYRPSRYRFRRNSSTMRIIYYIVAGFVKIVKLPYRGCLTALAIQLPLIVINSKMPESRRAGTRLWCEPRRNAK
jgi:hypothetical protein